MSKYHSLNIWFKLSKRPSAVAGMAIIAIAFFTAVFAYIIAPDSSENANRIIPEIANHKPGYSISLLRIKKQNDIQQRNWLQVFVSGKEEQYQYIPVTDYTVQKDSVVVHRFIDEGITEKLAFSKQQLPDNAVMKYHFYLGTDRFGRDILSRLIIGTRVSLSVGFIAVVISLLLGIMLGAVAGYFGKGTDNAVMWLINVIWSIPTLLLVFAITLLLGKGFWQVFIAVGLTMWVNVARLVRGQVMAIKQLEYVEAAKVLGFSHFRTITYHILPNILGPVMVIAAGNFASAIVIEAGLSFLGVGVQPPQPSWGLMIKEHYNFIITNNPMLAIVPGIAIMLLVLAFNLVGNGLRDVLNVKEKL